jgi:DNA-binding NtrC family response regulator
MLLGNTQHMEHPTPLKIFLVDDDSFSLRLYQQHLQNLGCADITCLTNGHDCLARLVEKPNVIFLDHNMEELDGFEVLKKIKRFNPNIYVVMVSAQENMKTAVDALKFGAFDYIIKSETVEQRMQDVLQRIHTIREVLKTSKPSLFRRLLAIF